MWSTTLPVEVMAYLLKWVPELNLLVVRGLSHKWNLAVVTLLEERVTKIEPMFSENIELVASREGIAIRRLILLSAARMSPMVLQSVKVAHLRSHWVSASEREIILLVQSFTGLQHFDLTGCLKVTEAALREVAKLS